VARADKIDLLQQHERIFVQDVSQGRRIDVPTLRKRIAGGPYIASEAYTAGLVDGYAFDDEVEDAIGKLIGRKTLLIDDQRAQRGPERFGAGQRVAIVYLDGDMVDGRSKHIPLVGMKLAGSYTIQKTLKDVRENPRIGAVVLRVESPGGSAMAADVIWREVQLTAKVKPVIVSMGSAAASGGYYVAAPATRIFANPLTITGSIGIFYGKADVAQLLQKIGVSVETYKTAPKADAESIFRPFTPEEKKELERKVAQFYDVFVTRVSQGRKLSKTAVDKVGQGRVWTGEQARARHLVDELGGLRQALAYARRAAGLPEYAPVIELPPPDTSLIGKLLGFGGDDRARAGEQILPSQILDLARGLAPFMIHSGDKPLARLEVTLVKP
jgi:protease-4